MKCHYRGRYGAVAAPAGSPGHVVGVRPPHCERRFVRCIAEIVTGSGTRAPGKVWPAQW